MIAHDDGAARGPLRPTRRGGAPLRGRAHARRGALGRERLHGASPPRRRVGVSSRRRGDVRRTSRTASGARRATRTRGSARGSPRSFRCPSRFAPWTCRPGGGRARVSRPRPAACGTRRSSPLSRSLGGAPVLTGHTRDDQAETVLLHLERRLGRGRGGIRPRRGDGVVRPLLPFSRAELREFLAERGVPYREDETNENEGFARNRIRRSVLPEMERKDPGRTARLARAGEGCGAPGSTRSTNGSTRRWRKRRFLRRVFGPVPSSRVSRPRRRVGLLVRAAGAGGRVPGKAQVKKVLSRIAKGRQDLRRGIRGRPHRGRSAHACGSCRPQRRRKELRS